MPILANWLIECWMIVYLQHMGDEGEFYSSVSFKPKILHNKMQTWVMS